MLTQHDAEHPELEMIELSEVTRYCSSNYERPYKPDRQLKGRLEVALQGHE